MLKLHFDQCSLVNLMTCQSIKIIGYAKINLHINVSVLSPVVEATLEERFRKIRIVSRKGNEDNQGARN